MKHYYVADCYRKVRLSGAHRTLGTAIRRTERLNKRLGERGRYMCGDWCLHNEIGVNTPHEWPWE